MQLTGGVTTFFYLQESSLQRPTWRTMSRTAVGGLQSPVDGWTADAMMHLENVLQLGKGVCSKVIAKVVASCWQLSAFQKGYCIILLVLCVAHSGSRVANCF